jgi:transposase
MKRKSKLKLGQKKPGEYIESEKRVIIEKYLSSESTKREIWEKYTGQKEEKGSLLRWMRQLGYADKKSNFAEKVQEEQKMAEETLDVNFEKLQLERRIKELEQRLETAELQRIAYQMMVEMAEKEFNISIKKKYHTQSLKK